MRIRQKGEKSEITHQTNKHSITLNNIVRMPAKLSAGNISPPLLLSDAFNRYCLAARLIFFRSTTVTVLPSPVGVPLDPGTNCACVHICERVREYESVGKSVCERVIDWACVRERVCACVFVGGGRVKGRVYVEKEEGGGKGGGGREHAGVCECVCEVQIYQ